MGKIGKQQLEKEMMEYFNEIVDKPLLLLEAQSVDASSVILTVENVIVLYILDSYDLRNLFDVRFVHSGREGANPSKPKSLLRYESQSGFNELLWDDVSEFGCSHPSVHLKSKKMHIAGLSAALRFILKFSMRQKNITISTNTDVLTSTKIIEKLLGYQLGCLQACAESSIWTKFCEVDMINMVDEIEELGLLLAAESTTESKSTVTLSSSSSDISTEQDLVIPKDLLRFEHHLKCPVRMHNVRKRFQNLKIDADSEASQEPVPANHSSSTVNTDSKKQKTHPSCFVPHNYAEGPDLTLSDLLILPCVHLAKSVMGPLVFADHLPVVNAWYSRLSSELPAVPQVTYKSESLFSNVVCRINFMKIVLPDIPQESLYKSDPLRYKAKLRLFTKQEDIAGALSFLSAQGIHALNFDEEELPPFHWDHLPKLVHPEGGQLPVNRIQKKAFQLSNLAQVVDNVYKKHYASQHTDRDGIKTKIVDFCSGGGHLGILLAYLLPTCEIILVENKEESLRRAETRIRDLGLTNITLYQSNLDYFTGQFHIGVALHACGTATDLVLSKCILQQASFVCCPCCYGAIQSNHMLHYPRSSLFSTTLTNSEGQFTLKHYFVLGHAADQTHDEQNEKTQQGKTCMRIVDTDRCLQAMDNMYNVSLKLMIPTSCSPKNHILIGVPQNVISK